MLGAVIFVFNGIMTLKDKLDLSINLPHLNIYTLAKVLTGLYIIYIKRKLLISKTL